MYTKYYINKHTLPVQAACSRSPALINYLIFNGQVYSLLCIKFSRLDERVLILPAIMLYSVVHGATHPLLYCHYKIPVLGIYITFRTLRCLITFHGDNHLAQVITGLVFVVLFPYALLG